MFVLTRLWSTVLPPLYAVTNLLSNIFACVQYRTTNCFSYIGLVFAEKCPYGFDHAFRLLTMRYMVAAVQQQRCHVAAG